MDLKSAPLMCSLLRPVLAGYSVFLSPCAPSEFPCLLSRAACFGSRCCRRELVVSVLWLTVLSTCLHSGIHVHFRAACFGPQRCILAHGSGTRRWCSDLLQCSFCFDSRRCRCAHAVDSFRTYSCAAYLAHSAVHMLTQSMVFKVTAVQLASLTAASCRRARAVDGF